MLKTCVRRVVVDCVLGRGVGKPTVPAANSGCFVYIMHEQRYYGLR